MPTFEDESSAAALTSLLVMRATLTFLIKRRRIDADEATVIIGDAMYELAEASRGSPDRPEMFQAAADLMMATLRSVTGQPPQPGGRSGPNVPAPG